MDNKIPMVKVDEETSATDPLLLGYADGYFGRGKRIGLPKGEYSELYELAFQNGLKKKLKENAKK